MNTNCLDFFKRYHIDQNPFQVKKLLQETDDSQIWMIDSTFFYFFKTHNYYFKFEVIGQAIRYFISICDEQQTLFSYSPYSTPHKIHLDKHNNIESSVLTSFIDALQQEYRNSFYHLISKKTSDLFFKYIKEQGWEKISLLTKRDSYQLGKPLERISIGFNPIGSLNNIRLANFDYIDDVLYEQIADFEPNNQKEILFIKRCFKVYNFVKWTSVSSDQTLYSFNQGVLNATYDHQKKTMVLVFKHSTKSFTKKVINVENIDVDKFFFDSLFRHVLLKMTPLPSFISYLADNGLHVNPLKLTMADIDIYRMMLI